MILAEQQEDGNDDHVHDPGIQYLKFGVVDLGIKIHVHPFGAKIVGPARSVVFTVEIRMIIMVIEHVIRRVEGAPKQDEIVIEKLDADQVFQDPSPQDPHESAKYQEIQDRFDPFHAGGAVILGIMVPYMQYRRKPGHGFEPRPMRGVGASAGGHLGQDEVFPIVVHMEPAVGKIRPRGDEDVGKRRYKHVRVGKIMQNKGQDTYRVQEGRIDRHEFQDTGEHGIVDGIYHLRRGQGPGSFLHELIDAFIYGRHSR